MSIINFINSWLKDIVVLFIIISLVDLIMPKGNMRRYVDFIIGLLVIFTVINPFLRLGKIDLGEMVINNANYNNLEDSGLIKEQENQIKQIYETKIRDSINYIVENNSNHYINNIVLDINWDEDSYGEINNLEIQLKDEAVISKNNKKISIEAINPVNVNTATNKQTSQIESSNRFDSLKDLISKDLQIEVSIIEIYLKNKER